MKSRLESAANVAVLVATVIFLVYFGRQEYERHHLTAHAAQVARAARAPLIGQTVKLSGMQFAPDARTLILAISDECHFCKASEPFYQQLVAKNHGKLRIVAVLPQPLAEARIYVHTSIAPSLDVVSSGLDKMGVTGTPTLLLVDGSGKVQQAWVGKLSDQGQKEVESRVK